MIGAADTLIHENEAIRSQVGFMKNYVSQWKAASVQKESDQQAPAQLILTIFYLREGLEDLYGREDNLLPQLEFSTSDQIKYNHKAVMNSLEEVYRLLIDMSPEGLQVNKESLSETIDSLCHRITMLSVQENEILKSHIN